MATLKDAAQKHDKQAVGMPRFTDLMAMSHIYNGIGSGCGAAIGFLVTCWYYHIPVNALALIGAALATTLTSNGGFIINDIIDIDIDRVNRPDRPLAGGRVPLSWAWIFFVGYTLVGLIFGFAVSLTVGLVTLATAVGLLLYSTVFKKRFVIGHLIIATMGGILLPFGGIAAGYLAPVIYVFPVTFLAFFAREVLKTVPDYEGDKANGVVNFSTRYGPAFATHLSKGLLVGAIVILPLIRLLWAFNNWFLVAVFVIIVPASLWTLFGPSKSMDEQVSRILRLSKVLFLLVAVAVLIGSLP